MKQSLTLNYTGRREIRAPEVQLELRKLGDTTPQLSISFNLRDYGHPDARLFVEAYCKDTTQRIDCGTAGNPTPPKSALLDKIDLSGKTRFRAKIVDTSTNLGLLVASAEGLNALESSDEVMKGELMRIRPGELGERVWAIDIQDGDIPTLLINRNIRGAVAYAAENPVFAAIVVPQFLREVLTYIWQQKRTGTFEDGGWQAKWLDCISPYTYEETLEEADWEDFSKWSDRLIESFCERFSFCSALVEELGGEE